ncbi:MAG: hypothetical protein R3E13_06665 [Alphaproteobacteria bacterium]
MRKFMIFQVFMVLLVAGFSGFAAASDLSMLWGNIKKDFWGPPHSDFVRPHLEEAKLPHNSRWADDEWEPQDWIDARGGSVVRVVNGFYDAGIIVDQYFDDDVPVLEVGQGFIELGAQDKRRVVAFMDEVFGVTKFSKPGVIMVHFHEDDAPIGVFNAQGLQLQ